MSLRIELLIFFLIIVVNLAFGNTEKYIYHTSDKLFYDAKNKIFELKGNVRIFYSDTKISCDIFRYYEERKFGIAEGSPRLYNPRVFIKSELVELFFEKKQVVPKNNVYIRVKNDKNKAKDSKEKWDYFEVFTDELIYNWENQNLFIPNKVLIVSKDLYLRADKLIYNDKTKTMLLRGNIEGKSKDQTIRADKLTYDMDKDIMTIEGNIKSIIKVSEQKNESIDSRNSEEKLIALQTKEIYDNVIKENQVIIDYFVKDKGFIPIIEVYMGFYSKVDVYRKGIDYKIYYPEDDSSKVIFAPISLVEKSWINNLPSDKLVAFYFYPETNIFFENYKDSISFIFENISNLYNVVMFTNYRNMNIASWEDSKKEEYIRDLLYNTSSTVTGYYLDFENDHDFSIFFNFFKNNNYRNQVFFVIDKNFWKKMDYYKSVVFNRYDFKVSILVNVDDIYEMVYDSEQFFRFLFWKSYLYGCSIFVNKRIYGGGYFRLIY